ncbi:PDDEXK family nuclease [Desulfogranum mediterraneum]|uniref:hypothetical protein n=1 Tax=Desulfogranum mediterraneum TaxID=160661 RepID=UPI00048B5967|nr:hypothetical protein [Desulfogranum mediterraneum]
MLHLFPHRGVLFQAQVEFVIQVFIMIHDIARYALLRDKRKVAEGLKDYFVQKNKQERVSSVVSAFLNRLRQRDFADSEARDMVTFLSRTFEIRRPGVEYAQAFQFSRSPAGSTSTPRVVSRARGGRELFSQLFLRLQATVQDKLLEYHQARSLVQEAVLSYPQLIQHLPR